MNEWGIKKLFVDIGRRMWERNYVAANDGNMSVRLNENEILTTPTGVSKGFMTTEMIIKVDNAGKVITGNSDYKPSSELQMHIEIYNERPDVNAVVHAHPPYATSFAVARIPLDKCVLPEAVVSIGAVPLASYGLPSTDEVPESIRPHLKNNDVILLENHGAITIAVDLLAAYYKMETLEHTANIISKAIQLGNLGILPEHERDRLMNLRGKYNMQGKITACDSSPLGELDKGLSEKFGGSLKGKEQVSDEVIKRITESVISKLKS